MNIDIRSTATPLSRKLYWDYNSWIHLGFIGLTAIACQIYGWTGLWMYPALHLISDILYYGFAIEIFDPSVTIQRGYKLSLDFNDTPYSEGLDYGFNFYNGDYEKSRRQAQLDKFEHCYRLLELEPGMKLIDIGCGCGDWLSFLQDKGLEVVGVNITWEQVKICRERGLTVHWNDWKDIAGSPELQALLYGNFDRVTFWDTVEHYVPLKFFLKSHKADEIYQQMFSFADNLLADESGRVFISCLHTRVRFKEMKLTFALAKKVFYVYMLDKFHSGNYPSGTRDCLVRNAKRWFTLESREDLTLDYYMTSKLEPTHFGRHKFKWTSRRIGLFLWQIVSDPFWMQRFYWFLNESWMDQFDEVDIEKSDMILWWLSFRKAV